MALCARQCTSGRPWCPTSRVLWAFTDEWPQPSSRELGCEHLSETDVGEGRLVERWRIVLLAADGVAHSESRQINRSGDRCLSWFERQAEARFERSEVEVVPPHCDLPLSHLHDTGDR